MSDKPNQKTDEAVEKYQKGSKLIREEENGEVRYQVFDSTIGDPVSVAREMYMDGKSLDYVLDELIDWFEKCKGKEAEIRKTAEEAIEEEEDDMDEDDEEEEKSEKSEKKEEKKEKKEESEEKE